MKKLFLLSVVVSIILTACGGQESTATTSPSVTPKPDSNAAATLSPTKTPLPTIPPTPTFTPFPPYHTKKVVFEYYVKGNLSDFDFFYSDFHDYPNIILYDDGQMLVGQGQKVLSADEMKMFLSKLDVLGFFSIESNQQFDPTDKLYNFGNSFEKVGVEDGLKDCILVNAESSRELCVQEDYLPYLIPEMKSIIGYLNGYKPPGLTPYYPDRILLAVRPADPNRDDLSATATLWNNRFPSLDFPPPRTWLYDNPPATIYIVGDMAKEIYTFITNSHSNGMFIQDGKKYIVEVDVVLPHKEIINGYQ